MKITLLLVGKTAFPYINEGISLYEKRLSFYVNYSKIEIPELKGVSAMSQEQIKEKEGELILKNIKPSDEVILLDERGNLYTSEDWARHLEKKIVYGGKDIVFVIGGKMSSLKATAFRLPSCRPERRNHMPHQIIRVIFLEQLYRAFTIIKGEPYHHR